MGVSRITQAVAAELANGVQDVLRQGAAAVSGNQGDYIANGSPESVYGKLQQATARQYCRNYADDPAKYPGLTRVAAENACRPYLDDINYRGGVQPGVVQPFRGGQCPGVTYRVDYQNRTTAGNFGAPQFRTGLGPFQGATKTVTGSSASINLVFANTQPQILSGPASEVQLPTILNVTRTDGLPDNCGSVPPDIVDPDPNPTPVAPRVRFNPSPDIDVDIGVTINVDGTVNIDFGTGPITIDPFADDAAPTAPVLPPGDVGEPGDGGSTGEGGEESGEAPPGSVLVGLKLSLVEAPPGAREYAPGIYRGAAYIYMGTSEGLDQDYAGSMLSDGQFVFAELENLTHWRVRANSGYDWDVTPYYREVEE